MNEQTDGWMDGTMGRMRRMEYASIYLGFVFLFGLFSVFLKLFSSLGFFSLLVYVVIVGFLWHNLQLRTCELERFHFRYLVLIWIRRRAVRENS